MSRYEPRTYWEELLRDQYNLSGVAYPELPESFNARFFRASRVAVRRALRHAGLLGDGPPRRVLDVGSGTGVWIDFWQGLGAREIVGVDLSETAVARLSARYPGHRFVHADVSGSDLAVEPPFDAASAMSVLLHIPDDAGFARAVQNVADVLRPGATAVVIDPVVVHHWWGPPFTEASNTRLRSLEEWREVFDHARLDLVGVEPVTWLLANPVDTRRQATFQVLSAYWQSISRVVYGRQRTAAVVAEAVSVLDAALVRLGGSGPSAKVVVGRRRADPA